MTLEKLPDISINELLTCLGQKQYSPSSNEKGLRAIAKCAKLMNEDYSLLEVKNFKGELSSNYPSHILIPESEKHSYECTPSVIYEHQTFDIEKYRELIGVARLARCRTRFPVPVILYRGKYICRSSTLSGTTEIFTRNGIEYLHNAATNQWFPANNDEEVAQEAAEVLGTNDDTAKESKWNLDLEQVNPVRQHDKRLIKLLNVGTIVDLMVENKKVKYFLNVTSSEKADKHNRYAEFNLVCLPYPGCEFFKEFKENNFCGKNLFFNWDQSYVDAKIEVPNDLSLNITWDDYKTWPIIQMTQNYMKWLLKHLHENTSGVLIHCISGWDRTPLFISLLRILLWADGAIHSSLSAEQMLFLTLAYDWYLFGHNMPDRLVKGEEILFFCFYVLKYFEDSEFSTRLYSPSSSGSSSRSTSASAGDMDTLSAWMDSFELETSNGNRSGRDSQGNGSVSNLEAQNGNRSSNGSFQIARTSPVSVPIKNSRTRNESYSSLNNSWHVISTTGSLRNSESFLSSSNRKRTTSSSQEPPIHPTAEDKERNSILERRKKNIQTLREKFYSAYFATIGVATYKSESLGAVSANFFNLLSTVTSVTTSLSTQ